MKLTVEAVREFSEAALPEKLLLEWDHNETFPEDVVREMCDGLGIQLLFIPEQYGGMGGGAFDVYRICETMARIDLGIATGVLATFLGSDPIVVGATDEQKEIWMTRLAEEGLLMAYGATEPEAGSDLGALRTTAKPVEEDGEIKGYLINGSKQWISNGGYADLYTILALTPGGPTWFVAEKGTEGLNPGRPEDKHGIRASNTAAISLNDVYVPADQLIGGVEGQGLAQAQAVFGYTRLMVAAFGLGSGVEAMHRAIEYSKERVQGGGPLCEKQGYTHKLIVPHVARLESARAYLEATALRIDSGTEGSLNTEGAIAKYLATEYGNAAAEAAIQALGGYGYTREYMVEKIKRDVRITCIYEGTSEIMEMTIGRDRWQEHIKTRGTHYHDQAVAMETLQASTPDVGAGAAALGLHALAEVMERCRLGRLTRNQHLLFRLGEMTALAECAAAMAQRAAAAKAGQLPDKSDDFYKPDVLAAMSRVYAREVALKIAQQGLSLVIGAGGAESAAGLPEALRMDAVYQAQVGMIPDMDQVADAIYGR
ncbi:MAG: acyl-CoA dehydrogenase family protein [Xanthomonadales bacterium]|nr:acyl-CoA dehydrogenase family protein [Xanthomonadales bacterium]